MGARPFPDNFISEPIGTEDGIHQEFEIVACGWVAVKKDAASQFQDSPKLYEAWRHHGEIGQHVVRTEKRAERVQHVGDGTTPLNGFFIACCGGLVPVPGVLERADLSRGLRPVLRCEQDVVARVGIEWRVEVDEIGCFVSYVLAKDVEVVPVVEQIVHGDNLARRC